MVPDLYFLLAYMMAMTVHELAHYAAARWHGVRVERLMVGWDLNGVTLMNFTHRGTVFGIGWLPLLSYVRLSGQERSDLGDDAPKFGRGYEVQDRTGFQRSVIELSGVLSNAMVVLAVLWCGPDPGSSWIHLATANAFLLAYNLAPTGSTDGGRVFTRIATHCELPARLTSVLRWCTVAVIAVVYLGFLITWVW